MSRTKRDILDTENMLQRLTTLLTQHAAEPWPAGKIPARADAEALRRISMTLHRWFEAECNGEIERQGADDLPYRIYRDSRGGMQRYSVHDRETGARKRLAQILKRYPSLTAYVQTDPRGCALYILKPGDVPEGADVSSYYSRGLAVFQ